MRFDLSSPVESTSYIVNGKLIKSEDEVNEAQAEPIIERIETDLEKKSNYSELNHFISELKQENGETNSQQTAVPPEVVDMLRAPSKFPFSQQSL